MEREETIDEAEETMERDLLIRAQKLISNVNWKSLPQDFDEVRLWLIEYDIWQELVLENDLLDTTEDIVGVSTEEELKKACWLVGDWIDEVEDFLEEE